MAVMETKDRYIVTIDNREFDIELSSGNDGLIVDYNGSRYRVAVDRLSERKFLYKIDGNSSEIDIHRNGGNLEIFIDGREVTARVEPYSLAELRKKAGTTASETEEKIIRAPMPGLVLKPEVSAGNKVTKGMTLVIIEAMKMENLIKSPVEAVVKEVFVSPGQAVDKNEKLVELE